jgi:hypothetical protein
VNEYGSPDINEAVVTREEKVKDGVVESIE